jgi:hypothetical protein
VPVGDGPIDQQALHSQWLLRVSSASWSGNFYSKGVTISELTWVVPAYPDSGVQDGVRGLPGCREWHGSCNFPVAHVRECTSPISFGRVWRFSDWGA